MQIQLANKKDLDGILALQDQIYRVKELHSEAKKILTDLISADHCDIVVAKDKDNIIGSTFLFYMPIPAHGRPYCFLEGMVVDKKFRGKGIGSNLLKKALEVARQKHCYKMIFTSGFDRKEIHNFYEKSGFKKWGLEFRMDLK
ncbi:hypothetical protein A2165_00585 [Candidatus Curtissbacteria bacterium RBG_13_40_7]|uniref:N-acetyltransferase domain-containing protein n=1 Tax=Candidatus Curtissbacteria bacterium RBG_13_40_7 TaxID=1797706 RepID=A0A1F5FTY9_9BACT|nr:MAG: hypothetical protein A2165_00585 [Candidatus Curtissbacteria bacterium RBG_13_40_7]